MSEYPVPVDSAETVSRFVLERKKFGGGRVKYRAFMPPPPPQSLSVYRIDGINEDSIWELGREHVAKPDKPVLARGDFQASVAQGLGLEFEATAEPHPRHSNLTGMPADTQCRLIAIKLADACTLRVAS